MITDMPPSINFQVDISIAERVPLRAGERKQGRHFIEAFYFLMPRPAVALIAMESRWGRNGSRSSLVMYRHLLCRAQQARQL
jgi:hypothetical protein